MFRCRARRRFCGAVFLAAVCLAGRPVEAGQEGAPVSIGALRQMPSAVLKENRVLSVHVPEDYEQTRLSYPVIYLLYGDQTDGYFAETISTLERLEGGAEIPEFIVVGIHNTDRYGNLLPVEPSGKPGGADTFLDFLEKELFPFVESRYRTKPYRLLVGPQAGGPFGLYSLTRRPALFNAMILENPFSAPASRELLSVRLHELATAQPGIQKAVFINFFERTGFQDHSAAVTAMTSALDAYERVKPAGLRLWRRRLDEPTFVPALELQHPLRAIFAGFAPPPSRTITGLADLVAHYREAGRRFGLELDPPGFVLSTTADALSRTGRQGAVQELLDHALGLRPRDTNALFRMGNLMLETGHIERAYQCFRTLYDIRPDPMIAQRLAAVERLRRGPAKGCR